jgi:hypothetical protein
LNGLRGGIDVKILLLMMMLCPAMAYADVQKEHHIREKQGMTTEPRLENVNDSVEKIISNKTSEKKPLAPKGLNAKPRAAKEKNTSKNHEGKTNYNEYQTIMHNDKLKDQQQEHELLLQDNIDTMYKKLQ